jgi:hypothetical protein
VLEHLLHPVLPIQEVLVLIQYFQQLHLLVVVLVVMTKIVEEMVVQVVVPELIILVEQEIHLQ